MKILYVGDPHAEVHSLQEMDNLIKLVKKTATDNHVDMIVFLGDQYHNHAIIHLQVLDFWEKSFKELRDFQITALVGNHDMATYSKANSMMLHRSVTVVDSDYNSAKGVLFVGYQANPQNFIRLCQNNPDAHTVVCHQTFYGSRYENGFFAPQKDSINPDDIPQKQIISGHIHTGQEFGKVWYPGSPRWRIATDANVDKFIYIVEHDEFGKISSKQAISTRGTCKPLYHLTENENSSDVFDIDKYKDGKVIVSVYGTPQYVKERKDLYESIGVMVRGFATHYKTDVSESDGIEKSFIGFVSKYKPKNGTSTDRLLELSNLRVKWN